MRRRNLRRPVPAAVERVQDDAMIADGPALTRIDERQRRTGRRRPAVARPGGPDAAFLRPSRSRRLAKGQRRRRQKGEGSGHRRFSGTK